MQPTDDVLRKVPPHSIEAEEAVLGGIILDNAALDKAIEHLGAADFYREAHRKVFAAMLSLSELREPIDLITLTDMLKSREQLQEIGGASFLAELTERVPTAANVGYYAKKVRGYSLLRQVISTATEIALEGYERPADIDAFVGDVEHKFLSTTERKRQRTYSRMDELAEATIRRAEFLRDNPQQVTGLSTGFTELDAKTAGLQPTDLIVIAARPACGKSALAVNIAQHVALTQAGVALFSLEMSKEQLVFRMVCAQARIDGARARTGFAAQRDFPRLAIAAERLSAAPIFIDDTAALSIMELRARVRRMRRERSSDIGLVVVDYLQLMRGTKTDSREQEVASIARGLKALAKEEQIPVVALSQLNRALELRQDKRPMLSDLRESGSVEAEADMILFIHRPWVYDQKNADEREAELIIGKQRNGPIGTIPLNFYSEFTLFEDRNKRQDDWPEEWGDE